MDLSLGCLATKKVGWLRALRPTEVAAYAYSMEQPTEGDNGHT